MSGGYNEGTRVYVGGLVEAIKKEDLEREFDKYGKLNSVWVAFNPPGFAFIEFENFNEAETACDALNGFELLGATLRVEISKRRENRGRGRGRGGGGSFRGRGDGFRGSYEGGRGGGFRGRGSRDRSGGGGFERDSQGGGRGGFRQSREGGFRGRSSFGGSRESGGGGGGGGGGGRNGYGESYDSPRYRSRSPTMGRQRY